MIAQEHRAAHRLSGKTLPGGWKVGKKIVHPHSSNNENVYSCCYEVQNGITRGFLKAFDYSGAERVGEDPVRYMNDQLSAYALERDILKKCKTANCKNVVQLYEDGGFSLTEPIPYPRVEYLILEYAENGDIRDILKKDEVTMEWKLRSLHQLCKGLNQIHKLSISHNDIKPVNIVNNKINNRDITKISDFGSAIPLQGDHIYLPKHLTKDITGTWAYAPPELLYGEVNKDTVKARIGSDLYLLGSMVVYYFTNMNMTSILKLNLASDLCWTNSNTKGKFQELKSYLIRAFELALEQIKLDIKDSKVEEKVIQMIRYLCNPDPERRGHHKDVSQLGSNYSLERFITTFDVLARYYWVKNK